MLRIIYRTCSTENSKKRPQFYSKRACLLSLLGALTRTCHTLLTVYDGPHDPTLRPLLDKHGPIISLDGGGNTHSFRVALQTAISYSDEDIVYFVEDDYLHLPDAVNKLLECCSCLDVDYVTLYDHPVRYRKYPGIEPDLPLADHIVYVTPTHHWQTIESTCMTFGAQVRTIKEDLNVFEQHLAGPIAPADRELFRHLQGLGIYATSVKCRSLLGPIPSLATHCEEPWLAPVIDWGRVAHALGGN
jgi:hypothetical protein